MSLSLISISNSDNLFKKTSLKMWCKISRQYCKNLHKCIVTSIISSPTLIEINTWILFFCFSKDCLRTLFLLYTAPFPWRRLNSSSICLRSSSASLRSPSLWCRSSSIRYGSSSTSTPSSCCRLSSSRCKSWKAAHHQFQKKYLVQHLHHLIVLPALQCH